MPIRKEDNDTVFIMLAEYIWDETPLASYESSILANKLLRKFKIELKEGSQEDK